MLILSRKRGEKIICTNSSTKEEIMIIIKDFTHNTLSLSLCSSLSVSNRFNFQIIPHEPIIIFPDARSVMRWILRSESSNRPPSRHQIKLGFDFDKSIIVHRYEIWQKNKVA